MPRGDKTKYTDKQIREADHITESYESRGVPEDEAERRAWATVNKESGGGKKSGAGRGQLESRASSRKGGNLVAKHQRTVRQRSVQLWPRKPLPLTGGTLCLEHEDILIAFILHTVP